MTCPPPLKKKCTDFVVVVVTFIKLIKSNILNTDLIHHFGTTYKSQFKKSRGEFKLSQKSILH